MDARPILFCRTCDQDVISLPTGACPWCDTQMKKRPPRSVIEQLHKARLGEAA